MTGSANTRLLRGQGAESTALYLQLAHYVADALGRKANELNEVREMVCV
jgi:hypothetical protein